MNDFDRRGLRFNEVQREYIEDVILEKNRLISLQERDIESLKREIISLRKQMNYSKQKRK